MCGRGASRRWTREVRYREERASSATEARRQRTRLRLAHTCAPVVHNKDAAATGTETPHSALKPQLISQLLTARHPRVATAGRSLPHRRAAVGRRDTHPVVSPVCQKITASATPLDVRSPCAPTISTRGFLPARPLMLLYWVCEPDDRSRNRSLLAQAQRNRYEYLSCFLL